MTKLMEWLLVGITLLISWVALITSKPDVEWYFRYFPVIFVILFGLYAATVVLYRTLTFNNCESAAVELQQEIEAARADLESKGIKLRKTKT